MELFHKNGCLTDEGLQALVNGELDELGRLEAAEHLSYCNRCLDRYTALLTGDVIEQPAHSVAVPVIRSIWVRLMQNTWGRAAVAGVAAALALTFWSAGVFQAPQALRERKPLPEPTPPAVQQSMESGVITGALDSAKDFFSSQHWSFDFFQNNGGQTK